MDRKMIRKLYCICGLCILLLAGCTFESVEKNVPGREKNLQEKVDSQIELSELCADGYQGEPYIELKDNQPDFTEKDYSTEPFEDYSSLDELGRCGEATANICPEVMPTEKRGEIGMIKPSGWHTVKYQSVDGKYLYNRCHLIGYQLAGENANEKNLITGTRYMNVEGMLPFENQVADYVKETGNHVLYRVTPVYQGDNLVAEGVKMEAYSVEDDGEGVSFHVFVYNVQPGIEIDYSDGDSSLEKGHSTGNGEKTASKTEKKGAGRNGSSTQAKQQKSYVLNKNTKKFHLPECDSVKKTLPKNRKEYQGNRESLIEQGYEPCERCKP